MYDDDGKQQKYQVKRIFNLYCFPSIMLSLFFFLRFSYLVRFAVGPPNKIRYSECNFFADIFCALNERRRINVIEFYILVVSK